MTVGTVLTAAKVNRATIKGHDVPARPCGSTSLRHRLKAAWLVFAGRADVVTYFGQ